MQRLVIILTFASLMVANNSFGQRYNYSTKNVKKLKTIAAANEGKIYIKTEFNETGDIYVFLINRTDSLLRPFLGHTQTIEFAMQALNTENKWQPIAEQSHAFYCAVGAQNVKLNSDHYTWQKIPKTFYGGDYATSIRFSFRFNDSLTILSKPTAVNIDRNLFLPKHERQLLQIDSALNSQKITQSHKERLLRFKLKTYYKYAKASRTVAIAHEIVKTNPQWVEGKDRLAYYLLKYIGENRKNLSKPEVALLISKTTALWEQVPKELKKIYHQSPEFIRKYDNLLLTKTEWFDLDPVHFEQIGEDYYAPLPILDGELVKIKFKPVR